HEPEMRLQDPVLAVADQAQVLGPEPHELTTQLRADRSARARDEHRATRRKTADRVEIRLNGIATQKVFDLYLTQRRNAHATVENLEQAGHRSRAQPGLICGPHNLS